MYAVIGDLVGSRDAPDRGAVHRRLGEVLREVATLVPGRQPLEPTVGDEFQGAYDSVEEATRVALLVRLGCLPLVDVRCGVGEGTTTVYDPDRRPLLQDGPAWWSARDALEQMTGARRDQRRTWYVGPGAAAVNAHLLCRDAIVDRLSDRGRRMLRSALLGHPQRDIAEAEGISPSAVSQAFGRGIAAVRDAQDLLRDAGKVGAAGETAHEAAEEVR